MSVPGDAELVRRVLAGDMRAFSALVDLHQGAVRGFLRRLTGNSGTADDVAQDAFVIAFEKLPDFEGRSTFRSFVCGIAYRVWQGQYRSLRRRESRERAYAENAMIEKPSALDVDLYLSLRQAMDMLESEQRAALALCLGAEFSHAEAASVLGLPLGTVKSHVSRGRIKLRQVLSEGDTEEEAKGADRDDD